MLANHFLTHFAKKYNKKIIKGFTPQAEELMINYAWPGNVRELKNLVERFVVLEDAEVIAPEHMPKWIFGKTLGAKPLTDDKISLPDSGISLEEVEKDLIRQALEKSNYQQDTGSQTAEHQL